MVEQWAAPIGRSPQHDERMADHTGQESRVQTGRGWRNLAAVDVKLYALGDRAGGQGRLWDRTSGRWRGGRYIRQDTCHETDVASALSVR